MGLEISLSFHIVRILLYSVDLGFLVLLVSTSMILKVCVKPLDSVDLGQWCLPLLLGTISDSKVCAVDLDHIVAKVSLLLCLWARCRL